MDTDGDGISDGDEMPRVLRGICFPWVSPDLLNVLSSDDLERTSFIRHFYAKSHYVIFDACAGPALGTQSNAEYLSGVVDKSTPGEKFLIDYGPIECGLESRSWDIGRIEMIK